jgi:hypothetical protein
MNTNEIPPPQPPNLHLPKRPRLHPRQDHNHRNLRGSRSPSSHAESLLHVGEQATGQVGSGTAAGDSRSGSYGRFRVRGYH